MSPRANRSPPAKANAASENGGAGAAWMADWTRQQMAVATAGTNAVLRAIETMRKINEETTQQASQRHLEAVEKLRGHSQPAELLAAQTELLRTDMEGAARYWQQITCTAMEMNSEVLAATAQVAATEAVLAANGRLPQS